MATILDTSVQAYCFAAVPDGANEIASRNARPMARIILRTPDLRENDSFMSVSAIAGLTV